MKKVVIVGYGSIGKRHIKNFSSIGCQVSVVSRRNLPDLASSYENLKAALQNGHPDCVFICTETSSHLEALETLLGLQFRGLILVEKPLFHSSQVHLERFSQLNVKIAYHMRFNPLIQMLKKDLKNSGPITSAVCYVGQYLPSWRPQADYRQSYSANSQMGGGVLLDLSHEFDYCTYLFDRFLTGTARAEKLSDLEISSEDTASILIKSEACPQLQIHLNYTDRISQRFLICNTNLATFKIDFMKKTYQRNDQCIDFTVGWNDPYLGMVSDVVKNNALSMTSFAEGFAINKSIDLLKGAASDKAWINL